MGDDDDDNKKTNGKLKTNKNNINLYSDTLLKIPYKSPTTVRTTDIEQMVGELFPLVT